MMSTHLARFTRPRLATVTDRSATPQRQTTGALPTAPVLSSGTGLFFAAYLVLIAVEYTGLKDDFALLKETRFTTIISYGLLAVVFVKCGAMRVWEQRQTRILAAFIVFTCASVMWATVQTYAFSSIRPLVDSLVFMIITVYLVDRRSRFDKVAATFAVVAVFVVIRNLDRLSSASRTRGMVAGYFMGDGNDFAWTMVVLMPIILVLVLGRRSLITRGLGLLGTAACVFAVIGTQSRGGTLGLGASLLFGWLVVSRRKALGAVVLAVVVVGAAVVAPAGYTNRIATMNQYEADSSAQGRLQMWGASIKMAFDYPLGVGAGNFSSVYGRFYMPGAENNRIGWAPNRWLSAHSIYFKVLGDYGFLGLGLLLWLLTANARDNMLSARRVQGVDAPPVLAQWPALINMSLLGYAVSGIFLGGLTYPHQYLLTGLTLSTRRLLQREASPQPAVSDTAPTADPLAKAMPRTAGTVRARAHAGQNSASMTPGRRSSGGARARRARGYS